MNSIKKISVLLGLLVSLGSVGCADIDSTVHEVNEFEAKSQAVIVTPEFAIHGLKNMPDGLFLTELGLSISEIRFQPVMTTHSGITYSTSDPFRLVFDVEHDEEVKRLNPFEFPKAGRFVVSIRLEANDDDNVSSGSLSMTGLVSSEDVASQDPRASSDGKFDGNPLPLPFDKKRESQSEDSAWTPFHYNSKRAVFYTFSDVELTAGEQTLSFNFNIEDWAGELIEPITRAVRNDSSPAIGDAQGVDVTKQLDSVGWGAEALMDGASVQTVPMTTRPGGTNNR